MIFVTACGVLSCSKPQRGSEKVIHSKLSG
jgi:hypothetical protein